MPRRLHPPTDLVAFSKFYANRWLLKALTASGKLWTFGPHEYMNNSSRLVWGISEHAAIAKVPLTKVTPQ